MELTRPLSQVAIEFEPHGWPMFITLLHSDGTGLRVRSEMHDVAERREVGVLCFSYVPAPASTRPLIDVPQEFQSRLSVFKLVIEEAGTRAESGVILTAGSGKEITIVVGAKPYCLAIRGLQSIPEKFELEYPIERYARIPFDQCPSVRDGSPL
jgi:hypothetical protein